METLREIINSNALTKIFNIPANFRNRNVEVIITLVDSEKRAATPRKSAKGRLRRYANPDLIHMEKGAWAASMGEKHTNS